MDLLHKSRLMAAILVFSLIVPCFIVPVSALASTKASASVSISTASEKAAVENTDKIIQAYKVSEAPIENGTQFRIAIPVPADAVQSDASKYLNSNAPKNESSDSDAAAASVFYIDVSIQGSGGNVVGKVWHLGFLPSHNLEIGLWAGNTAASSKITSVKTTNIAAWPGSTRVSWTPIDSKFWDMTIVGTMAGRAFYYSTHDFLFNKKAVEYPVFVDCFGNVSMAVPSSAAWSKVSNPLPALTTAQRNAYITWYEQTYNNGNALNWNDVQIHHIKPRAYGGTHAYSNLMPLRTLEYATVTIWWANY